MYCYHFGINHTNSTVKKLSFKTQLYQIIFQLFVMASWLAIEHSFKWKMIKVRLMKGLSFKPLKSALLKTGLLPFVAYFDGQG